jgi:hypothetical protein
MSVVKDGTNWIVRGFGTNDAAVADELSHAKGIGEASYIVAKWGGVSYTVTNIPTAQEPFSGSNGGGELLVGTNVIVNNTLYDWTKPDWTFWWAVWGMMILILIVLKLTAGKGKP